MAEETTALLAQALTRLPLADSNGSIEHYLNPEVLRHVFTSSDVAQWSAEQHTRIDTIMGLYLDNAALNNSQHYWAHRNTVDSYVHACHTHLDASGVAPTQQRQHNLLTLMRSGTQGPRGTSPLMRLILASAPTTENSPDWLIEAALELAGGCSFTSLYETHGGPADFLLRVAEAAHELSLVERRGVHMIADIAKNTTDRDLLDYCLTHPSIRVFEAALGNPLTDAEGLMRSLIFHEDDDHAHVRVRGVLSHEQASSECRDFAVDWVLGNDLPIGRTTNSSLLCDGTHLDKIMAGATVADITTQAAFTASLLSSSAATLVKEQWIQGQPDACATLTSDSRFASLRTLTARGLCASPTVSPALLGFVAGFITLDATSKFDSDLSAWYAVIEHPDTPLDALRPFSKGPSLPAVAVRKRLKAAQVAAGSRGATPGGSSTTITLAPTARQKDLMAVRDTGTAVHYLDTYGGTSIEAYVTALAEVITSPASLVVRREVAVILTDTLNHDPALSIHADPDKSGSAFKAMGRFRDPLHFTPETLTHLASLTDHPVVADFAGKQLGKALLRAAS